MSHLETIPDEILDPQGYPTDEYLEFIRDWEGKNVPILEFIKVLQGAWKYDTPILHRKHKGVRKLTLSTGGWSGNEDIIDAIKGNIWLVHVKMKYTGWERGGHYTFEVQVRQR